MAAAGGRGARHLKSGVAKLLAVFLILGFGFTPQIAEWDSVLSAQSLSLSLFFLSLGILIELAFSLGNEGRAGRAYSTTLAALWFVCFALWLFVRDAHLYAIPVTLLLAAPLFWLPRTVPRRGLAVMAGLLAGLLALGLVSSRQSSRWPPSIEHSMNSFVLPYADRVEFMQAHSGMPQPGSDEYAGWFETKAPAAFSLFLLSHPGFILRTVFENWTVFTYSYEQPYFPLLPAQWAWPSLVLGELFHPGSGAFYLIATLALLCILLAARGGGQYTLRWAWVLTWLFLAAGATLFLSFFGDTAGVMRHVMPSVEAFRLLMWLALLVVLDSVVGRRSCCRGRSCIVGPCRRYWRLIA